MVTNNKTSGFIKGYTPWNKGKTGVQVYNRKPMTAEQIQKMSETAKKCGAGKWMKGRKLSLETRKKISENNAKTNWQGGKTAENLLIRERLEYKLWRESVFIRDGFTCQNCGENGCYIEAHHIKSFSKFTELRFAIDNGVTLCKDCHKLTDNYKGKARKYACNF